VGLPSKASRVLRTLSATYLRSSAYADEEILYGRPELETWQIEKRGAGIVKLERSEI
jgi:hypothetical protein